MSLALWTDLSVLLAVLIALAQFLRANGAFGRGRRMTRRDTERFHPLREVLPLVVLVGSCVCAEWSALPASLPAAAATLGDLVRENATHPAGGPHAARWTAEMRLPEFRPRLLLAVLSVPLAQAGCAGIFLLLSPRRGAGWAALGITVSPLLLGATFSALAALLIYLWTRNPFRRLEGGCSK